MKSFYKIMGILNVTPDSFSDGGSFFDLDRAVTRALEMAEEGADIIDIGGESSRPGAEPVTAEEELRRVIPVIRSLRAKSTIAISIDTTKSRIAAHALEAGATIINDISAGRLDSEMFSVAAMSQATLCLMHMQGAPKNMQEAPHYEDVVEEVKNFLRERMAAATATGVAREKIWIDPGIGFGKTVEDNLRLLRELNSFQDLNVPILIGTSRKSFIGALTHAPVHERLAGSLASLSIAAQKGAQIFRVHDIAATKQFLETLLPLDSSIPNR